MPKEVVWWAMRKLGVEEWLVRMVKAVYKNSRAYSYIYVSTKMYSESPVGQQYSTDESGNKQQQDFSI